MHIPTEDQVKDFLATEGLDKYVPKSAPDFISYGHDSSQPAGDAGNEPIRLPMRKDALNIYNKILAPLGFPKNIVKSTKNPRYEKVPWRIVMPDGHDYITVRGLERAWDDLERQDPDALVGEPKIGDVLLRLRPKEYSVVVYTLPHGSNVYSKLYSHKLVGRVYNVGESEWIQPYVKDPKGRVQQVPGLKQVVFTSGDVWEFMRKYFPDVMATKPMIWISNADEGYQINPAPEPGQVIQKTVDVSKIRLGKKQRAFLDEAYKALLTTINDKVAAFHKYDALNLSEADEYLKEIEDLKRDLGSISLRSDDNATAKSLAKSGLLTVDQLSSKKGWGTSMQVTLTHAVLDLLEKGLPDTPTHLPASERKSTEQIVREYAEGVVMLRTVDAIEHMLFSIKEHDTIVLDTSTFKYKAESPKQVDTMFIYPSKSKSSIPVQVRMKVVQVNDAYEDQVSDYLASIAGTPELERYVRAGIEKAATMFSDKESFIRQSAYRVVDRIAKSMERQIKVDVDQEKYPDIKGWDDLTVYTDYRYTPSLDAAGAEVQVSSAGVNITVPLIVAYSISKPIVTKNMPITMPSFRR